MNEQSIAKLAEIIGNSDILPSGIEKVAKAVMAPTAYAIKWLIAK